LYVLAYNNAQKFSIRFKSGGQRGYSITSISISAKASIPSRVSSIQCPESTFTDLYRIERKKLEDEDWGLGDQPSGVWIRESAFLPSPCSPFFQLNPLSVDSENLICGSDYATKPG
jgi:hypothetical protein